MRFFTFLAASILCVSGAYAGSKDTAAQHITLDTLTVTAKAGPDAYRASATHVWDFKNTRIALSFNRKEKTADAKEWIKMRPFFYPTDTIVLDAKGMRIDSVELVTKKGNAHLNYTYENNQLTIRFGHLYHSSDTVELYLKYKAMPYASATGGSAAISDDRGLYFINTDYAVPHKPAQIWTQGETESNSHWLICVDKPNTRFTTQVELTIPDSFQTLSNGAMIKSIKGKNGMRTDIWRMDMPIQAYATMFAIGKYSIIKDHWKNKEVNYYVEPEYAPYARKIFNNTPEMIEYFSKRTGVSYPWNKYDQVVVRDYVSGAMENTTASLFGEFMNEDAREIADHDFEDVVSHELFHMWFGDYVTCESWSNLTVNESFANYGEQLWRAHKYGKYAGDHLAYTDLLTYIYSVQGNDPQLVRFNYADREDMFDRVSYEKGGAILRYLNNLIGDEAFDKSMNIYLTKNALHQGEAHNWRLAIEEATGQDWNWFFNEYYYHAGHPVIKVIYNYNDSLQKLVVAVSQTQSDSAFNYELPLKTAVIYGNDKTVIDWNITKRKDTFTYAYKNGVKPVIVPDYTHVLVGELKDTKKPAQWLEQYKHTDDYISKRMAIAAATRLMSDSNSQAIIDMGLNDKNSILRQVSAEQLKSQQSDKYRKRWQPRIEGMASFDSSALVRAAAFGVLGEWKVNAAKPAMVHALYDSSYSVSGAALTAIANMNTDTAYIYARQLLSTHPRSSLQDAIWTSIGKKGNDEDVTIYENKVPYVYGSDKFQFAISLSAYLKNVKSEESFKRGVAVYATLITTENIKSYRSPLGSFMFGVAGEYKDDAKSTDKDVAAKAQKRMDIVKPELMKIIVGETDPETATEFKKLYRDNYGEEKK